MLSHSSVDARVVDVLRRAYAAFNARDIDTVLSVMQPDVKWLNGMEGGYVRGHADVRSYWTRQWITVDPHVDPVRFETEADGRIAVTVHQVVRDRAGTLLFDREVQHVYRFDNGLVADM